MKRISALEKIVIVGSLSALLGLTGAALLDGVDKYRMHQMQKTKPAALSKVYSSRSAEENSDGNGQLDKMPLFDGKIELVFDREKICGYNETEPGSELYMQK